MKRLLSLLVFFHSSTLWAAVPLISSPQADPREYREYLKQNTQYESYSSHVQKSLQKNEYQEQRLFRLSDTFETDISWTILHLKGLQQESPLTLISLRYTRDLAERILALSKITNEERKTVLHLFCKSSALLREEPLAEKCKTQMIQLRSLRERFPHYTQVVVESVARPLTTDDVWNLSANTAYHWTLLSDSFTAFKFYGTYDQLMQQTVTPASLVEGTCENFQPKTVEFSAMNPARIYFSSQCQKDSHTMPEAPKWYVEKKTWLYTAGALVAGALVYSQVKDKKLVLERPF